MNRAVFLDRDGVINEAVWNAEERALDSPYRVEDFHLLPGVADAVHRIHKMGFLAVVVSNQPGVAKAKCSFNDLNEITRKMHAELAAYGAKLDQVYYCYHHPQASVADLRINCDCRKPKPGLIFRASLALGIDPTASYMVGDQERDVEAGQAAGCTSILVRGNEDRSTKAQLIAADLLHAVHLLPLRTRTRPC